VASLDFFASLTPRHPWMRGAVAGACVGAVGCVLPEMLGGGNRLVESMLDGRLDLLLVPGVFLVRFGLTMVSYGCGTAGGIFAPLLVLGAAIGLGIGGAVSNLVPALGLHAPVFAAVGMAAYFSAIVRAPLTGIVLLVEMTGNYSLVLPLLAASLTAYGVADFAGDRPIYEALLERDLLRTQASPELEKAIVLDFTILPGAEFDGRTIGEIGLPGGCLLILVRRGTTEEVPTSDFRLAARDQITAVISPGAAHAIAELREGTA
jgi:CIC family chloride channel protein